MKKYAIPTGYLFTENYTRGELETLSIGDYGKSENVKADFIGYTDEINGVKNTYCKPLSDKWVITISTQYGCSMNCTFCDVPNVKMKGNVSKNDMWQQVKNAISLFPQINYTERLNLHYARMGEPIFNTDVFDLTYWIGTHKKEIQKELGLRIEVIHPVLSTSLPKKLKPLRKRIMDWCFLKNDIFNGQAGLQFSVNSTNDMQRSEMFRDMQLHLTDLSKIAKDMPDPLSRKYCLNFAYSTDFEIDAKKLSQLFDPDKFMCKITPIHNNNACKKNQIETINGYNSWQPYQQPERDLKAAGFDVLIFVPSIDEEDGLVTCGNVVLGGGKFKNNESVIKIKGI